MKKYVVLLAVVLGFVGIMATQVLAQDAVKVHNKICPISGEPIGEGDMAGMEATVEYKGKIYNLCCPMCKEAFLKDPEGAIKKLEELEEETE